MKSGERWSDEVKYVREKVRFLDSLRGAVDSDEEDIVLNEK